MGFLLWWIFACQPSQCDVINAFIFAIADALALIGLITLAGQYLPGLAGCVIPAIPALLGLLNLWLLINAGILNCPIRPR